MEKKTEKKIPADSGKINETVVSNQNIWAKPKSEMDKGDTDRISAKLSALHEELASKNIPHIFLVEGKSQVTTAVAGNSKDLSALLAGMMHEAPEMIKVTTDSLAALSMVAIEEYKKLKRGKDNGN